MPFFYAFSSIMKTLGLFVAYIYIYIIYDIINKLTNDISLFYLQGSLQFSMILCS